MSKPIDIIPSCVNCRYCLMQDPMQGICSQKNKPLIGVKALNWSRWPLIYAGDWCWRWTVSVIAEEMSANLSSNASSLPTFDGIPVLPLDEPAPAAPSFPTYDEPFEDPLR